MTPEQKETRKLYMKEWREANKEHLAKWYRDYRKANPEVNKTNTKKYRENNHDTVKKSSKKYKDNNQDKIKTYRENYKTRRNQLEQEKRKTDPLYKLKGTIRSGMLKAFKRINNKKNNKTELILGCSFEEFKKHIESQFENWMNWGNHGLYNGCENYGWDIDHITPISTAVTEEDVIRLSHHTNLRPLCSKVNRDIKRNSL
jgi:hypothetical protein